MNENVLTESCAEVDAVFSSLPRKMTISRPTETIHLTRQPGDGYWAIAPGASDISEGMVWVKTNMTTE